MPLESDQHKWQFGDTDDERTIKEEKPCKGDKNGRERLPTFFVESGAAERDGLILNGSLKVINYGKVTDWSRVFELRFVHTIKYKNSRAQARSRLVANNYGDEQGHIFILQYPL